MHIPREPSTLDELRSQVLRVAEGLDEISRRLAAIESVVGIRSIDSAVAKADRIAWPNGRRPDWWGIPEVRAFVVESHRQMTLGACLVEARRRFGADFPISRSSIQRVWGRMDKNRGDGRR